MVITREFAIHQVIALYGHIVDDGELDRLDEVFAADAVFDLTALDGQLHEGLSGLRDFFGLGSPPHPPSHHTTNVWVGETDSSGAVTVRSKWMTIDRATGSLKTGDYLDELVLTDRGWRIRSRVVTARWWCGEPVRVEGTG